MRTILYRADFEILNHSYAETWSEQELGLVYHEYPVIKETKEGYWIERVDKRKEDKPLRFVLKEQSGKRFAYLTKDRALEALLYRRRSYNGRLKSLLRANEKLMNLIKESMAVC